MKRHDDIPETTANMTGNTPKMNIVVASDVRDRNGIGVEVYVGDELMMEVFRNDAKKTCEVTLYKSGLSLDLVEEAIARFRKAIPWDFTDDTPSKS